MMKTETTEKFTYWKRPWHKWLILGVGILQIICLWMNLQDLNKIAGIWERIGIFKSVAEWESYVTGQYLQCALNGLMAAVFLSNFVKGFFVKSKRESECVDFWLMAFFTVGWGILGIALNLTTHITWWVLMITALGLCIYSGWVFVKGKK